MQIWLNTLYIVAVAYLCVGLVYCICARAEYEINGQCCPMCAPGNRVFRHCMVDISTSCLPCSESTYIDEPNGFEKCISCTACHTGLRIQKACTRSSDTVCEPQEGFFCSVTDKGSCKLAVTHSQCKPGEYIQQRGTAGTDTVCGDCTNGTFSDGTFTSCQPHTVCQSMGRKQTKAGTTSSDAKCEYFTPDGFIGFIIGVVVVGVVAVFVVVGVCKFIIFKQSRRPVQGYSKAWTFI